MPWQLTKAEVKSIFIQSVSSVADINDPNAANVKDFTFNFFQPFHKIVFLSGLKQNLNNTIRGSEDDKYCFDIDLNENMFNDWHNFGECLDFIFANQKPLSIEKKVAQFV